MNPLPLPPRKIRPETTGARLGSGCLKLFFLPFLFAGIALLLALASRLAVSFVGTSTTAEVRGLRETSGSKGSKNYQVDYRFTPPGAAEAVNSTSQIDKSDYLKMKAEETSLVPIRYLPFLPNWSSNYIPLGHRLPPYTLFTIFFAVVWVGFVVTIYYLVVIRASKLRRVLETGLEATGTLTEIISGRLPKNSSYNMSRIRFSYIVGGETYQRVQNVPEGKMSGVVVGDDLRVTYDPRKPKWAVAVDFSHWDLVE
jgi:hypothetical protein